MLRLTCEACCTLAITLCQLGDAQRRVYLHTDSCFHALCQVEGLVPSTGCLNNACNMRHQVLKGLVMLQGAMGSLDTNNSDLDTGMKGEGELAYQVDAEGEGSGSNPTGALLSLPSLASNPLLSYASWTKS